MILLTPEIGRALRVNDHARHAAQAVGHAEPDPAPVVKFFNPAGPATWLASELAPDGDTLFGLADLGFGCPELGIFSLRELSSIYLPFGLRIEQDLHFATPWPLSHWAEWARRTGSLLAAEQALALVPPPGLPFG
jgi:hypothetical protein